MIKVELRHFTLRDSYPLGTPYYMVGATPYTLINVPNKPSFFVDTYKDFTSDFIINEEFKITYRQGDNGNHFEYATSNEIEVVGEAKTFILNWLVETPAASQNAVEVRLTDTNINKVIREFLIKPQKISICKEDKNKINVTLQYFDYVYECLNKTSISDDARGIYEREFRAYEYGSESYGGQAAQNFGFYSILVIITGLLTVITAALNLVLGALGTFQLPTTADVMKALKRSVGVGRMHPAAGVSDYSDNVCSICRYYINTAKNFFYRNTIPHLNDIPNDYKNLEILYSQTYEGYDEDDAKRRKLINGNVPILQLTEFYNNLAKLINGQWWADSRGLSILPKSELYRKEPILKTYDLQENESVLDLCIDIPADKYPVSRIIRYSNDAIDVSSDAAISRYDAYIDYAENESTAHPSLKDKEITEVEFGRTRFRDDNINEDYLDSQTFTLSGYASIILIVFTISLDILTALGTLINGSLPVLLTLIGAMVAGYLFMSAYFDSNYNNIITMSLHNFKFGKPLIRDESTPDNNKRVKGVMVADLVPNDKYNKQALTYQQVHKYNKETVVNLKNYPLFYDEMFKGNLYDRFFQDTDPKLNNTLKRSITAKLKLCIDNALKLGVYNNDTPALRENIDFRLNECGVDYEGRGQIVSIDYYYLTYTAEITASEIPILL